jgi:AraC family transcriptional regulator
MGRPTFVTVEAELRAPGVIVQVGSYDWDQPLEVMEQNTVPSISLLLSPPHEFSEACFSVVRGGGRFADVGDVIFAPADLHLHCRASGGPIRLVRCFFERNFLNDTSGFGWNWEARTLEACVNIRNARIKETLARLGQEALDPGLACAKLTEGLGMLVAVELGRHFQAIEEHARSPSQKLTPWQMNRITQYLETLSNYLPEVGDIAELCGISARHLRRLFKETTDQTIYQYARDVWAAKAKTMLSDTRTPVKEIASRLGFSDASSFSMAFRRATGEPPKAFRQQFRKPGVH